MSSIKWDIRRSGRFWLGTEAKERTVLIPDRPEIPDGKLYWSDEERLTVLACLLENLGLDATLRNSTTPALWREALDSMEPRQYATVKDLADEAIRDIAALDRRLGHYFTEIERLEPNLAMRLTERVGDKSLAPFLALAPIEDLGGKSALQRWAEGDKRHLEALLGKDDDQKNDHARRFETPRASGGG